MSELSRSSSGGSDGGGSYSCNKHLFFTALLHIKTLQEIVASSALRNKPDVVDKH